MTALRVVPGQRELDAAQHGARLAANGAAAHLDDDPPRDPGYQHIIPADRPGATWRPVDLAAALAGGCVEPPPVLLTREDDQRLLYAGKIHTISGESESLKTWLVLLACASVLSDGGHVLFVDYEDGPEGIAGRLLALGCAPAAILDRFHYVRPAEPFTSAAAHVLDASLPGLPALAVVDGVTEAMAAHGLNPIDNADVARFAAILPRPLADAGSVVALIDHMPKAREARSRYAIGAQHKLAAVTGVAYTVDLVKPFGRGLHGVAKITVAKDRPGQVDAPPPARVAGWLHLESMADGSVMAKITPPGVQQQAAAIAAGTIRPAGLMQRISEVIEAHPGLSGRSVRDRVSGKDGYKRTALELLVEEGYVAVEKVGVSHRHTSIKPFREEGVSLCP